MCHLQAAGGDRSRAEGLRAWLASRDAERLHAEASRDGGRVLLRLDGQQVALEAGKHFTLPSSGKQPVS